MTELEPCPFGADHKVWIAVHDDEGNYKGESGCDYESDPWSGLSYGLHHEGWGTCPLCTDDEWEAMGGMLFDTPEEAAQAWHARWERTCRDALPKKHGEPIEGYWVCHAPGVGTSCPIGLAKAEGRCELYEERDGRGAEVAGE